MNIQLIKLREDDLEQVMEWRMMPEVTKYMYTDPILTMESQRLWYERINKSNKDKYWIIQVDNVKIGLISLNDIDYENKKCSWGYYIGNPDYKGRGIARHLELNIYEYIFEKLKLNKLRSEVLRDNELVIKIHESYGSNVEGVLKEEVMKNNTFCDVVFMGITKSKWNQIQGDKKYNKIYIED